MDPLTLLLLALVILGAAFAGYMIGRWSVLSALEDVANRLDPDSGELVPGRNDGGGATIARGPATHSEDDWRNKPIIRSAKPPPVLAGHIDGVREKSTRPDGRSGAKKPPASAG